MKHTINFQYPISYVRYQHSNANKAFAKASVEVEFAELKSEDCHLVFEVGNPLKNNETDPFAQKSNGELRKVLAVSGKLYVEFGEADGLAKNLDDPYQHAKTPFADLNLIQFKPQDYHDRSKKREIMPTTTIDDIRMQYRKWSNGKQVSIREELTKDDQGQEMAEKITKRAAEVIIVDGVLFRECREPILGFKRYRDSLLILNAPEPGSPNEPYPVENHEYGNRGSSLKDAAPFIQLLKNDKVLKNDDKLPEFKVHDASFCRYDGSTIDTMRFAKIVFDELVDHSRALSKDMLEIRFALGSVLNGEKARLKSVSPKLVKLLTKIADSRDEPVTPREGFLARYNLLTETGGGDGSGKSQSQVEKLGFHVASARLKSGKGLADIRSCARVALKRWEIGAGYDRLAIKTTDSMISMNGDTLIREVNSAWQLRMLCERADWNFDEALSMVDSEYQLFELDRTTAEDGVTSAETKKRSAVVGLNKGKLRIISDVDQLYTEKEAFQFVEKHIADDLEAREKAELVEEFAKDFKP
jgi:hypothetical protein